jgi:multidrug efflux pump subunit AcrB
MLAWFARNRVAANLLMLMILLAGFLAIAFGVRREMFPLVSLDVVVVRVPYPGATPVEVEEGILLRVEEAIADLDGIDTLDCTASEGLGLVTVKVRSDYETRKLLDDVKTRVGAITTFPKDAEEATVEELTLELPVITVALTSETADAPALRRLAEDVREELLALEGITQVKLGGVRPYEIGIHVSEESLRRHGLTFDEVAGAVRASSLNVPAGAIRAGTGDIRIRTEGQAYRGPQFEDIVLLTNADGTRVRLKDVATVVDGFEEDERWTRFDGHPAVMLSVLATGRENVPDVAARVHRHVRDKQPTMPAGVRLDTWFDFSRYYTERQDLMLRNGLTGLVLVFLCLALFLHFRLAFWVAMGLVVSFVGTFAVLWYADVSINMISMAAFILVLGIVVDDAIVVSESVHHKQSRGEHGEEGAVSGVIRVAKPVIFAVLTSVIAFLPMFAISGVDGKFWRVIPIVIISCLLFSLVESMLILPAHLSHEPRRQIPWYLLPVWPVVWLFVRLQKIVDAALQAFIRNVYRPALEVVVSWRYMTLAVFLACLILTVGLVAGGRIRAAFFPRLPGDVAVATLEMPNGTGADATRRVLERIETATEQVREELDGGQEIRVVKHVLVAMGGHPMGNAQEPGGFALGTGGSHLAEVTMEFENLYQRGLSSEQIADRWRQRVGIVPGVRRLTFNATEGDEAKDFHIRLASDDLEQIEEAAQHLKQALRAYAGVYEISDTLGTRQPEITLRMKPAAETLGLRGRDLARQVRQAFYGEEAQRVQRGRDEIRVMVRYPLDQRRSIADLNNLRVRTPSGDEVPLAEVAQIEFGRGMAAIRRSGRKRVVDVTAMLDRAVIDNPDGIMVQLQANGEEPEGFFTRLSSGFAKEHEDREQAKKGLLAVLPERYPGLSWSLEGGMKDQQRVMKELGIGFVVALFAMYAMMAIAFNSYIQPLLVAAAIPFGFVGAVAGHAILGETVSIISFLGLVALAGVVVNDSLVLIDAINRITRQGRPIHQAVRTAAQLRFRAILLTSLTTFLGLTPMMLETSMQARFIIPMAVALAFGVAFATLITLTLVPALYVMIEDAKRLVRLLRRPWQDRDQDSDPRAEPTPAAEPRDTATPIFAEDSQSVSTIW